MVANFDTSAPPNAASGSNRLRISGSHQHP
jgi:hypothetical protein